MVALFCCCLGRCTCGWLLVMFGGLLFVVALLLSVYLVFEFILLNSVVSDFI